jgi:hypothetical protein
MKAQGLIMLLAFGVRAVAQVTLDATLTQALTASDALRGSAVLKLQDLKLSYELNLTGRSLYSFDLDAALAQGVPSITLGGVETLAPLPWLSAGIGEPNFDIIIRLPGEPPLPDDHYWAHHTWRGSASISDTMAADLLRGEAMLTVDYGPWGTVSGRIVAVSPAVIDRIERDGNSIRFHLTGPQLYDYTVEFTDSLTTTSWSPLARYRAKLEPIDVVVTNSFTNAQARFFRVRQDSCSCR